MSQLNRSSNKNVVSEQKNKVEEAINVATQNCTATRNLPKHYRQPALGISTQLTSQLLPRPADDSPTILIAKS